LLGVGIYGDNFAEGGKTREHLRRNFTLEGFERIFIRNSFYWSFSLPAEFCL